MCKKVRCYTASQFFVFFRDSVRFSTNTIDIVDCCSERIERHKWLIVTIEVNRVQKNTFAFLADSDEVL